MFSRLSRIRHLLHSRSPPVYHTYLARTTLKQPRCFQFSTDEKPLIDLTKDPLMSLNEYYRVNHGFLKSATTLTECDSVQLENRNFLWTATLTDPISGQVYQAGQREGAMIIDSKIYYTKKNVAIAAAAARALDAIQFQEKGMSMPRFCLEDPSTQQDEEEDETMDDGIEKDDEEEDEIISQDDVSADAVENDQRDEEDQNEPLALDQPDEEDYFVESDKEEELILVYPESSSTSRPISPALRALDQLSHIDQSTSRGIYEDPMKELEKTIEIADAWLAARNQNVQTARTQNVETKKSAGKHPHRLLLPRITQADSTFYSAKAILAAMANARRKTPLPNQGTKTHRAASGTASKILDALFETEDAKPDTEIYNLFLLCIQSGTRLKTAQKAQTIVNAMKNGDTWRGTVLPPPNATTYDILIQLWAFVGGEAGRYQSDPNDDFVPTRDSFLAILSSNTRIPPGKGSDGEDDSYVFDIEFARTCVARMKQLSDENPEDSSLIPDTDIYNAAMPWSGGVEAGGGKFDRPQPFPIVSKAFSVPFDENSQSVKNARLMKAWVDEMIDQRLQPNIRTYESLIQAWIRTGTSEGVTEAEKIVEELLSASDISSDCTPRYSTIHPLLMGHLLLKNHLSYQNAMSLYEKARDKNLVDERTQSALVSALKEAISSEMSDYETRNKYREFIIGTIRDLSDDFHANYMEGRHFLDHSPFVDAIAAIATSAKADRSHASTRFVQECLAEMEEVLSLFEKCLSHATAGRQILLGSSHMLPDQLIYLLTHGHTVFATYTDGIAQIARKSKETGPDQDLLLSRFFRVESCVRRVAEFNEITSSQAIVRRENKRRSSKDTHFVFTPFYEDMFTYEGILPDTTEDNTDFPKAVVKYLKSIEPTSATRGDLLRLASLLEQLATTYSDFEEQKESIEKLTRLLCNRSDFFKSARRKDGESTDPATIPRSLRRKSSSRSSRRKDGESTDPATAPRSLRRKSSSRRLGKKKSASDRGRC